jgi:hypothetical protein
VSVPSVYPRGSPVFGLTRETPLAKGKKVEKGYDWSLAMQKKKLGCSASKVMIRKRLGPSRRGI